jgi:hypothetical protein
VTVLSSSQRCAHPRCRNGDPPSAAPLCLFLPPLFVPLPHLDPSCLPPSRPRFPLPRPWLSRLPPPCPSPLSLLNMPSLLPHPPPSPPASTSRSTANPQDFVAVRKNATASTNSPLPTFRKTPPAKMPSPARFETPTPAKATPPMTSNATSPPQDLAAPKNNRTTLPVLPAKPLPSAPIRTTSPTPGTADSPSVFDSAATRVIPSNPNVTTVSHRPASNTDDTNTNTPLQTVKCRLRDGHRPPSISQHHR